MKIKITNRDAFREVPWKNGKGVTLELGLNEGGSSDCFDWRISIADVVESGFFSYFNGCQRNLTLIEGEGIELTHDDESKNKLVKLLDVANFDGASKTFGTLFGGPIKAFNVIVDAEKYSVEMLNCVEFDRINLSPEANYFVYGLKNEVVITNNSVPKILPAFSLIEVSDLAHSDILVEGEMLVIVKLEVI